MGLLFDLQRFKTIEIDSTVVNSVVSGTAKNDSIRNNGSMITIQAGAGRDTVYNNNSQLTKTYLGEGNDSVDNSGSNNGEIYGEGGNDTIENWSSANVTISGGAGNDSVYSYDGDNAKISGGAGNDTIYSSGSMVTISGDDGNDSIYSSGSSSEKNLILGGAGKDSIYVYYGNNSTMDGGDGDDSIEASYGNNIKIYGGTGNDSIRYWPDSDRKNNLITVAGGKGNDSIDLHSYNASHKAVIQYASGDGNDVISGFSKTDTLQISATTFFTVKSGDDVIITFSDGGSILLEEVEDNFSAKNLVTVKGGNSGGSSEKNSWKLNGTTAKFGTSSKTLATVNGVKSVSGLSTSDKKITLKNSALSKKVTVSGSYEFDFASDYKNATISGTAKADTITARGSGLKIFGGKGKDSIKMIGTNQTVSGGAGADTFIYAASDGKEKITDFSTNDKLKIGTNGDGTYSTVTSGDNLIVSTDDGGKITLVGAASLSNVNIIGTKKTSGAGVKVSGNGKKITLTSNFDDSSFSLSGKYSSAVTLDASAALLELSITGNKFANKITGSSQNDTIDGGAGTDIIFGGNGSDSIFGGIGDDELHGGKGKDTLWGGAGDDALYGDDGKDVFYYNTGEGNDTIFGYEAIVDKIILASGTISNVTTDRNNNVIFSVGDGQIVVNKCADRTVKIVNSSGKIVDNGLYEP